uniref:Uncharacterized protein n=1 Tax=Parascaris univalens TaxID=6257 RepID=A0A914ZVK4_PARUN
MEAAGRENRERKNSFLLRLEYNRTGWVYRFFNVSKCNNSYRISRMVRERSQPVYPAIFVFLTCRKYNLSNDVDAVTIIISLQRGEVHGRFAMVNCHEMC